MSEPKPMKWQATKLTKDQILRHLRLVPEYVEPGEWEMISAMHRAAVAHTLDALGIDEEYLDSKENLAIAVLCLIGDMYDNRSMSVDADKPNRTVHSIFALYDENLIA